MLSLKICIGYCALMLFNFVQNLSLKKKIDLFESKDELTQIREICFAFNQQLSVEYPEMAEDLREYGYLGSDVSLEADHNV